VKNPLSAANNEFTFRLGAQLFQAGPGKNIFFSPYSIHAALCMTLNGAVRETLHAMRQGLCLGRAGRQRINAAHRELRGQLEQGGGAVQIAIANALWAEFHVELLEGFRGRCAEFYAARAASLDFSNPQAADEINAWVAEQTRQKIKDLLKSEDLKPPPVVVLVNAIYFKGAWQAPFDPRKTQPRPFTLLDGATKSVAMMAHTGAYGYLEGPDFQAASLPYGSGETSLVVFLPGPASTLAHFLAQLTLQNWERWLEQMEPARLDLALPRFKLESEAELSRPLAALGMEIAFTPAAEFGEMCHGEAFISKVRHKAFLEVNEAGSEAAAATAVVMVRGMLSSRPPRLVLDRPFFCAIRHNPSRAILFAGAVYDPQL
jgi:serine protease inhibitor